MIKPLPNEKQTDFAIRFHTAMLKDIPHTDERNRRMLETWDQYGHEPETEVADSTFDAEHYERKRNIAIFAEHTNPERQSVDGRPIPAETYDRDTLKAIADGHNYRIRDTSEFPPITDGHTSPRRDDPKPATLGFSGTCRLGMVGNENPRWALFHDEFTRKDAQHLMKDAPGRSVEVLRHPDMKQRRFYPIAALRANAPRLNLPPARYSVIDGSECPVDYYQYGSAVDRYEMAAPGGNNTSLAKMADLYGNTPGDTMSSDKMSASEIMEALRSSQLGQLLAKILKKEMAVKPLEPNTIPEEPEEAPATQPAMPGQQQSDAGQSQQQPPVTQPVQQENAPPAGQGKPGQPPQGHGGGTHIHQKGPGMSDDQYENEDSVDRYAALEAEIDTLRLQLTRQIAKGIRAERRQELASLAEHYQFDVDAEMERVDRYSAEQFNGHLQIIQDCYRRRPESAVEDFAAMAVAPARKAGDKEPDYDTVARYADEHEVDYLTARSAVMAQKA